jgi:hypothetical protein
MPTTQLLGVTLEGARTVVAGALAHARGKANGALNLGVGCRSLAARAAAHPAFINSVVALTDGGLVPAAGGVLVRDDGDDVIGRSKSADPCPTTTKPALFRHRRRGATRQPRSLTQPFPVSTGAQPMNAYLAKDGTWHIRLADGCELRRHYFTRQSAWAQIAQLAALR